jgi:DNA-binding transcriptional MerR regulator
LTFQRLEAADCGMDKPLLTITELARRTGISSRTIRFWSDAGLVPVAQRTAARYRLYDAHAVSRLDLVHTLRELGLGLPAITAILRQQQTLVQVATTHVAALEARIRDLRLQRAVLRVVIRRGSNTQETQLMQKLAQTSAAERQRLIDDFVARAFDGIPADAPGAHIAQAMRWGVRSLPAELPDDPSDAQVDAWIELAALVSEPAFAARVREMALAGAAAVPARPVDMAAIREHAGAALAAGIASDSRAASELVGRIVPNTLTREERVQLRKQLETFNDVRVERYWQLMAALHCRPAFPPLAAACDWFIAALRATE